MTGLARVGWILLLLGFGVQVVLGHVIAFGLDGPLMAWHQDRVGAALWGNSEYATQTDAYRGWIQALLGGTMIAWAWTMLAITAIPLRRREPWAKWVMLVSTLNWFVIDTGVSWAHGVTINVAFNCVALGSIVGPLGLMVAWLRQPNRAVTGT